MKVKYYLILLLLFAMTGCSAIRDHGADPAPSYEIKKRNYDSILVLGGGGVRGAAHIGVLKAMEEIGIVPNLIIGTSAGAVIGGLWASGMKAQEIEDVLKNKGFSDFIDLTLNKEGIVKGERIEKLMNELSHKDIEDFTIPFIAVATDLKKSREVYFNKGKLGVAVRASVSIPGAFVPLKEWGMVLVDGGVLNVNPIKAAKDIGAKNIILSDIYCSNAAENDLSSALNIAISASRASACRISELQLDHSVITLKINVDPKDGPRSLSDSKEMIEKGYSEAKKKFMELREKGRLTPH